MKIKEIAEKIDAHKVMDAIAMNEISGNLSVAYRFSRASGGNSGYSFGRSPVRCFKQSVCFAILAKQVRFYC